MCVTLDSTNQTWTINNYTGGVEIHIGHTLPIGQQRSSTKFPSTSAELVSKSEVNGRLQLTSRLTIVVSESTAYQIHSVTCSSMMDATSVSFQIAAGIHVQDYEVKSPGVHTHKNTDELWCYDYCVQVLLHMIFLYQLVEACNVVTTFDLTVTTTRETVASSEAIQNIGICKLNSWPGFCATNISMNTRIPEMCEVTIRY